MIQRVQFLHLPSFPRKRESRRLQGTCPPELDSRFRGNDVNSHLETTIKNLKTAFTLIELLVVVAIISLLAALLMPALKNARQTAYKIQCINNVRTLTTTALMYVQDNDDYLPGVVPIWSGSWAMQLASYVGIKTNTTLYAYGVPYGKEPFHCPRKNKGTVPDAYNGHYMYSMNFMLRYA